MNTRSILYNDVVISAGELKLKLMVDSGLYREVKDRSHFLHNHRYYELFYVKSGRLSVSLSDRTLELAKDEIIIIPPGTIHQVASYGDISERYCLSFIIEHSSENDTENRDFTEMINSMRVISTSEFPETVFAFERLAKYRELCEIEKNQLISACFHEILYLLKLIYRRSLRRDLESSKRAAQKEDNAYLINSYINLNFAKNPSLSELAGMLYLSERQANRLICEIYGRSFKQQIVYLRMQNATKLLRETDLPVKQIAEIVGYRSLHGFYTVFAKAFELTSVEFRRLGCETDAE